MLLQKYNISNLHRKAKINYFREFMLGSYEVVISWENILEDHPAFRNFLVGLKKVTKCLYHLHMQPICRCTI
jgi:hypothetical protein